MRRRKAPENRLYGEQNLVGFPLDSPRRRMKGFVERRFFGVSWFLFFSASLLTAYDSGLAPQEVLLWGDGVIPAQGVLVAPFIYSSQNALSVVSAGAQGATYASVSATAGLRYIRDRAEEGTRALGVVAQSAGRATYDRVARVAREGRQKIYAAEQWRLAFKESVASKISSIQFQFPAAISLPRISLPRITPQKIALPTMDRSPFHSAVSRGVSAVGESALQVAGGTGALVSGAVHTAAVGQREIVAHIAILTGRMAGYSMDTVRILARAAQEPFPLERSAPDVVAFTPSVSAAIIPNEAQPVERANDRDLAAARSAITEGRLRIPSVGLDARLVFPTSTTMADLEQVLRAAPAHYPLSALPGAKGNTVLFGHSSRIVTSNQSFKVFNRLPDMTTGETIILDYGNYSYEYRAVSMRIATENAVIDLESATPTLTLTTCWLFDDNKEDRYILEAEFVKSYPTASRAGLSADTSS